MTLATDLMGLGMPAALAAVEGFQTGTIAGVGTAQGGSSPIVRAGFIYRATTSSGQTAVTLDSAYPLGGETIMINTTATAMLLFPPTGANINGGSANASFSVAQNKPVRILRFDATNFIVILSA